MGVEIGDRQYSIRVYGDDETNYVASAQVFRYGDKAFVYSINGTEFYANAGEIIERLKQKGVVSLEGYAGLPHARLMGIALKGIAKVEIQPSGDMDGHELAWVVVRFL